MSATQTPVPPRAGPASGPLPVAGARGLTAENAPSLRLPGEHFAAAVSFLVLGSLGLVWVAPELAAGLYPSPRVAGVTHLFTLGWLATTIFGALYQMVPVALGARVWSERVAHASFWCLVPGVALFAGGVITFTPAAIHTGVGLITVAVLLAVANYVVMLRRAIARDVTWWAIAVALSCLVLTLLLGATLAINLTSGFLARLQRNILVTHLHLAAIGFVLLTIVGVGHRLLPMFLLAHGADGRWSKRAVPLLGAGVLVLCAGLDLDSAPLRWASVVILEAGVACFYLQARTFLRAKKRPTLDAGLRHAALGLIGFAAAALLAPAVLVAGGTHPRLAVSYVLLGIAGGLAIFVIGIFYKIVPFLAWMARFRNAMGRRAVPTIADLYSAKLAAFQLRLLAVAVPTLVAGVALGSAVVVRIGALVYAAGIAVFAWQMAGILHRDPTK